MAKILGNLVAPVGKYIKDGEEKTKWMRCGILMETDKGMRVKLEGIPLGIPEGGLWMNVFADDNNQQGSQSSAPASNKPIDDKDDIPF